MSFTPRGADGLVSHLPDERFPPLPECCVNRDRRCANIPFLFQVEHPPWYTCPPKCPRVKKPLTRRTEFQYQLMYDQEREYMKAEDEGIVLPTKAFWFYCDQVPDIEPLPAGAKSRNTMPLATDRAVDPWPPLAQGVCPPPRECSPCGPGPWDNPNLRRFFYMDCQ